MRVREIVRPFLLSRSLTLPVFRVEGAELASAGEWFIFCSASERERRVELCVIFAGGEEVLLVDGLHADVVDATVAVQVFAAEDDWVPAPRREDVGIPLVAALRLEPPQASRRRPAGRGLAAEGHPPPFRAFAGRMRESERRKEAPSALLLSTRKS